MARSLNVDYVAKATKNISFRSHKHRLILMLVAMSLNRNRANLHSHVCRETGGNFMRLHANHGQDVPVVELVWDDTEKRGGKC